MTNRWPCIVVVMLCSWLAVATSAATECAWVLWVQSVGPLAPSREWLVHAAFQTYGDCTKKLVGPLNAAMANVLPANLRARGFAVTTMVMHLLGDAASPWLIGVASDRVASS